MLGSMVEDSNAFAFLDPPYRAELRGKGADKAYACELPEKEQKRLFVLQRNVVQIVLKYRHIHRIRLRLTVIINIFRLAKGFGRAKICIACMEKHLLLGNGIRN